MTPGDMNRVQCAECRLWFSPTKPHHTECRHCWALPRLLGSAQRLAGVEALPVDQWPPDEVEAARALLRSLMAPERGPLE